MTHNLKTYNTYNYLLLILLSIFFLSSCKTFRKKHFLKHQNFRSDSVISNLNTHEFNFNTLDGKVSITANVDDKKQSFSAHIRMKKDSIIWVSVSPFLGIEMMRLILTPDSAKALNRIDNTYFLSDNNYLKTLLSADVDFRMLQSIITGNDFPHFEKGIFEITKEDSTYLLQTNKRYKIENNKKSNTIINQVLYLGTEGFKIIKNNFSDIEEKYKFEIAYTNFKVIDNQLFPLRIECKIKTSNQMWNIIIEFSKLNLNADLSYPFTIPDKYTKMP